MVEPAKPTTLERMAEDYLASCRARGLDRFTAQLLEHGGKRGPLCRYSSPR